MTDEGGFSEERICGSCAFWMRVGENGDPDQGECEHPSRFWFWDADRLRTMRQFGCRIWNGSNFSGTITEEGDVDIERRKQWLNDASLPLPL